MNNIHAIYNQKWIELKKEGLSSTKQMMSLDMIPLHNTTEKKELTVISDLVVNITETIKTLNKSNEAEAEKMAGFEEIASIKGIGKLIAAIFLIGNGYVNDFATADKLTAYLGIVLKGQPIQYEGYAWKNRQTWK